MPQLIFISRERRGVAVVIDLDRDQLWVSANGAVLDKLLKGALADIDID